MAGPVYEDFVPTTEFKHEENSDTLLLHLPGFGREQLRVQLSRGSVLRISGSRPVGDNKWKRFQKEFPVSANTDTGKLTAKFEDGILFVKQPKLITTQAERQDQSFPPPKAAPAQPVQKPAVEPGVGKDASPEQQATKETSTGNDQEKREEKSATNGKEGDEQEKKEEKSATNGKEGDDQEKKEEKSATNGKEGDDQGKKEEKSATNGKETRDKEEDEEKTRLPNKLKTSLTDAAERKDEGAAAGTENGAGKTRLPNYRDIAAAMAARFEMPRHVMNAVLVALVALLVGLYVSNLIRSFTKAEN